MEARKIKQKFVEGYLMFKNLWMSPCPVLLKRLLFLSGRIRGAAVLCVSYSSPFLL